MFIVENVPCWYFQKIRSKRKAHKHSRDIHNRIQNEKGYGYAEEFYLLLLLFALVFPK